MPFLEQCHPQFRSPVQVQVQVQVPRLRQQLHHQQHQLKISELVSAIKLTALITLKIESILSTKLPMNTIHHLKLNSQSYVF